MLTNYQGKTYDIEEIIEHLQPHLTSKRLEKMQQVIQMRSQLFVPVLERIFDQGNINAVLRSAESMAFQNVHIIENESF